MAAREYKAYLLRMWRENQGSDWRALLENPNNGERAAFATFSELVTFLETQTGESLQLPSAVKASRQPSANSFQQKAES